MHQFWYFATLEDIINTMTVIYEFHDETYSWGRRDDTDESFRCYLPLLDAALSSKFIVSYLLKGHLPDCADLDFISSVYEYELVVDQVII